MAGCSNGDVPAIGTTQMDQACRSLDIDVPDGPSRRTPVMLHHITGVSEGQLKLGSWSAGKTCQKPSSQTEPTPVSPMSMSSLSVT